MMKNMKVEAVARWVLWDVASGREIEPLKVTAKVLRRWPSVAMAVCWLRAALITRSGFGT